MESLQVEISFLLKLMETISRKQMHMENECKHYRIKQTEMRYWIRILYILRNFRISLASEFLLVNTGNNYPFKLVDSHSTP